MRHIMITGASTGIGRACVASAIARGFQTVASVRTAADATSLTTEFGTHVTPIIMDVTDSASISQAADVVSDLLQKNTLAGLVNNAGIAVAGPSLHLAMDEFRHQFEVNFFGQIAVTQAFAPLLGSDRQRLGAPGRIINISSLGGKLGAPYLAPYVASKHALEGWSECLRRELLMFGIDVIIVGPGAIATPIWRKAEQLDVDAYQHTDYAPYLRRYRDKVVAAGIHGLAASRVGDLVLHALTTRRPRTRYALAPNILMDWWLPRWLPARWIDRLASRSYGLPEKAIPRPMPEA